MNPTDAIVFHVRPLFEKDLLIELFTSEFGRIKVFAKYAQSKKPRFGGQLNTLNLIQTMLIKKGTAVYLGQTKVSNHFSKLKKTYNKMNVAYQFLHVIRAVTQINQENKELFHALVQYLTVLNHNSDENLNGFKLDFYKHVLQIEGLMTNSMKLNEHDIIKMIESYTNIHLKDIL